ncbi:MAG: hypothetical protein ABSF64_37875 [Bryobacteraceae bacterium]
MVPALNAGAVNLPDKQVPKLASDSLRNSFLAVLRFFLPLFAFVDAPAKTFLTYIPEPPRDVHDQAAALGKLRYDRFLKSVGMAMVGDSQAAMAESLGRGHEN